MPRAFIYQTTQDMYQSYKLIILTFICLLGFAGNGIGQETRQSSWAKEFNQDKLYLPILDFYHPDAGIDYGDGLYHSRNDIYLTLINLKAESKNIESVQIVASDKGRNNDIMEIGLFKSTTSKASYYFMTGWKFENNVYLKEMEFIRKYENPKKEDLKGITKSRIEWMKYSNAHAPADLINNVYTSETQYYNNGHLSEGRSELIQRYDYMSSNNWSIELIPVKTVQLSDHLAFEIGTYISNGQGQYMLVWEKGDDDIWRVAFDFNF